MVALGRCVCALLSASSPSLSPSSECDVEIALPAPVELEPLGPAARGLAASADCSTEAPLASLLVPMPSDAMLDSSDHTLLEVVDDGDGDGMRIISKLSLSGRLTTDMSPVEVSEVSESEKVSMVTGVREGQRTREDEGTAYGRGLWMG